MSSVTQIFMTTLPMRYVSGQFTGTVSDVYRILTYLKNK